MLPLFPMANDIYYYNHYKFSTPFRGAYIVMSGLVASEMLRIAGDTPHLFKILSFGILLCFRLFKLGL